MMKILGIVMLAVGVAVLAYGGITASREKTVAEVGPLRVSTTETSKLPVSQIAGGIVLLSGLILLVTRQRRATVVR